MTSSENPVSMSAGGGELLSLLSPNSKQRDELSHLIQKKCSSIEELLSLDSFSTPAERIYFQQSIVANRSISNLLSNLSYQELFIASTLEIGKLVSYLGYRFGFKHKLDRIDITERPVFLLLEPSSSCNLKCPFCFQSDPSFTTPSNMGHMSLDLAFSVIDQANDMKIRGLTLASRGEPLLNKNIFEIIKYASSKENIYEIKLNTNGLLLTPSLSERLVLSGVNIVVFSTDHYDPNEYKKLRKGGSLERLVSSLTYFKEARTAHHMEHSILSRVSGVCVSNLDSTKFLSFYSPFVDEVGQVEMLSRWNTYDNSPSLSNPTCCMPSERLYVWYDGTVNPCDSDYLSKLSTSNVTEYNLAECWSRMSSLRSSLNNGKRASLVPCNVCDVH